MSKYQRNDFNTTDLTLSVMGHCAWRLGLDINDDEVADKMYWICCDLESWPEGEGFSSSDGHTYVQQASKEFGICRDDEFVIAEL